MTKVLKPYTIIPEDLYVQRDADRQIKHIINDMGRPGYVLVSRQMGKTNLLINAKRTLEGADNVFVYIDLSNTYEDPRSCFENIIDTAIETNIDKFDSVQKIITENRNKLDNIPPHKQHTNELRLLLQSISGKLVIILDEIDALTKTNYSDQIFAQIRSIYFSRINYPELKRLTYILSGVIEPSEIIKDPKISPFNIGQKIFLNDFSRDEFEQLLAKSQLYINQDIKERIYYWTNGNPRMSWDVCSEIENLIKSQVLTTGDVDDLVISMYLSTYDRPPVDHIRELVKEDREIRNAIIEIEYKKGSQVSQKIKSKLYLSGIINYHENDVAIKNRILKEALNIEWIRDIDEADKGLLAVAMEYYDKFEFSNCLQTFERYLDINKFSESQESPYFFYMGYSAYRISDFKKALEYLNKTSFDKEDEVINYYRTLNLKGLLYYYTGDIDSSLDCFKSVLSRTKKDELYARALVNFGSISLKTYDSERIEEAKSIFKGIVDENEIDSTKIDSNLLNEYKAISLHNLAQIELSRKNIDTAIECYKRAIAIAPDEFKIKITLGLIQEIKNEKEKNLSSVLLLNVL